MRIIKVQSNGSIKEDAFVNRSKYLKAIHDIAESYLSAVHQSGILTTDMDGVLIHDDNAIMAARIVSGPEAQVWFGRYADANLVAVAEGMAAYCWYAPTLFVGRLLKGLSPEINRVVGRHIRLIPGAEKHIDNLLELGYDITAVTAGHQESAEEISNRVNIGVTYGTQLGVSDDGVYDGIVQRFIGGSHKLDVVEKILEHEGKFVGTHVGDSWSDIETLAGIPDSVAYNPGCELALRNARISVLGVSLLSLLPFFDPEGKYDSLLKNTDLPDTVILMLGQPGPTGLTKLFADSREIKKKWINALLDGQQGSALEIEERIKSELREKGVDFRTRYSDFMSVDEFDAYAKKAYEDLE
ncbi:haloacid dehalogenase-like hydrolase [Candidatus Woesearchaeota archaeon]|nr:haloacid dehalogenase-like hydrolase [Candidatus Woesearchaeota archaeon]MBW3005721.1 haloacid dehalogenase-like hydrolase [Candidatus Woesearchaeota archaeon]